MGENDEDNEAEWEGGSKGAFWFHAFDLQVIKLEEPLPPADCH